MATLTPHFGWLLPAVNDPIDQDQWGDQLNSNITAQDALIYALSTTSIGVSRPSYAAAGTQWIDNTTNPWIWKMYDGTVDIVLGNINTTTNTFTPAGSAALTTKGDLLTYSTLPVRLGVGTNGQVLTADSSQATGMAWANTNSVGAWFYATQITTGQPSLAGSYNIASVTRTGIGEYTVNFTTNLPSANYACSGIIQRQPAPAGLGDDGFMVIPRNASKTSSLCDIQVYDAGVGTDLRDVASMSMIFVGG